MKVSRKRPTMDSQEKSSSNNNNNKDKAMEEEEEQQQQQQEEEGEQHQEKDEEIQEEEQQEEEEEEEEEQQQQEAPRLEEGFYEMEAIRKRRVRKAQLQYLIKWRGWPESANTWEPIDNLQACSDVVDAFEERLQKSSRKRKRRGPYSSVGGGGGGAKNRRRDGPDPGSVVIGEDGEGKVVEGGDVMRVDDGGKGDEEKKEDGGFISIQLTGGPREDEGLVEDGLSKVVDSVQPLQGAKKRKSGCVRRFKQEAVMPQGSGDGKGEKLGGEDVDWTEVDNAERQKVEEDGKPPYIAKLLRAVEFQASVTNNVQQVSIKFKALRSDGQEVLVDDKELKVRNPLLLISFYEQHLRYSPPACDVNEQQS